MTSLLQEGSVASDSCVLRQTFRSRQWVQDASGILVGCTVGQYGGGLRPTAASSRITYENTKALLINHNKMTIRLNFRIGASNNSTCTLLAKWVDALTDNQWAIQLTGPGLEPTIFVANAPADFGQSLVANALALNTRYVMHAVYDGALAAASRLKWYNNGAVWPTTLFGTPPVSMRSAPVPVTVFNRHGGATRAPATDFVLYDFAIWNRAFSAIEVLDDALGRTYALGGP